MSTTVMDQDISMPIVISPTGAQTVGPAGEVAVARAAAARGTAMGLPSFAGDEIAERVLRAREVGAVGLRIIVKVSPEVLTKPRWLWSLGEYLNPPDLRVPNQGRRGEPGLRFFEAIRAVDGHPTTDLRGHLLAA